MAEKTTSFTGPIVVGLNDKKGEIRLTDGKDVNEAKYLSIKAPDVITSDTTLTFPNGAGTAGQILSTDGNGGLSWVNDSAGNPDGSNGQVQVNDNGAFGAISEGTSGQVLTSNGAGSAPTFQTASGGGADPVTSSLDIPNTKNITFESYFPVGDKNVVWGVNAGTSLTGTPIGNILIGDRAGNALTTSNGNVAIGKDALDACVNQNQNVAIGNAAAGEATSGQNTVIGDGAGGAFTTGQDNTFVGRAAGFFGNPSQTVAIGSTAMLTGGGNNCAAVGYGALSGVSGNNNTGIGDRAGDNIGGGSNNTCIGHDSDPSTNGANNEITLGDSSISTLRCNTTSITSLSDARDKKDVEDANIGLDFINDLRPVKFVWDTRDGAKKDIKEVGFIAQELDEVQQKHGVEDHLQLVLKNNPDKLEASQGKLIPILVQAIKDLKKELDELKKA